jgi:hypothetical protein
MANDTDEMLSAISEMNQSAARGQVNRLSRQIKQLQQLVKRRIQQRTARKRKAAAAEAVWLARSPGPAQRRALRLPEICHAIFGHLGRASLAAAARACRAWFGPAVQVLWRVLPPDKGALAGLPRLRMALYTAAVRELCVLDETPLDGLDFPAVRVLRYSRSFASSAATTAAAVANAVPLADVLDRCGDSLAVVEVTTYSMLAHLSPPVHEGGRAEEAYLAPLARRPGLRALHYREYVCSEAMVQAVSGVIDPFSQLRELALCLRSNAVPAMVTMLGGGASVAVLSLRIVHDTDAHNWRALFSMSGLRELSIQWDEEHYFTADEFVQFAHLPRGLLILRLINRPPPAPASILSEHWREVLSALPNLVVLRADVIGEFSGAALRIVGETCRLIEDLRLRLPCQPWLLDASAPEVLFPHLRVLEVDTYTGFERLT